MTIKEQAADTRVPGIILKTQSMNTAERLLRSLGKVEKTTSYYLVMGGLSYLIERMKIEAKTHGWDNAKLQSELRIFVEQFKNNRNHIKRFLANFDGKNTGSDVKKDAVPDEEEAE